MKRIISIILIVSAFIMSLSSCNTHKDEENLPFLSLTGKFTNIKIIDETTAVQAAQDAAQQLGLGDAADELTVKSQSSVNKLIYYRLQQNCDGIPVYGRTMVVVADENGNAKGITSNSINISDKIDTAQEVDDNTLKKALSTFFDIDEENIRIIDKEKVIYGFEIPELCCRVSATFSSTTTSFCNVIVSAKDKKVVFVETALNPATICTSSTGLEFSGSKKANGEYVLFDKDKKFYCLTANENATYSYMKKNWNNNSATAITSDGSTFDKQYDWAFIAKNEIDKISNFYISNFSDGGTESFALVIKSGTGTTGGLMPVKVSIDLMTISDIDDEIGTVQIGSKEEAFPSMFTLAHEYTHVITNNQVHWVSGVDFQNEAQAINEAYSDLFGMIINKELNKDDECIWDSGRTDVSDLSKDNYPLKVNSYDTKVISGEIGGSNNEYVDVLWLENIDKAYTYSYAVTLEHAAYLMSTDNKSYGKLSIDELSDLWYNTMLTLPSNCTFSVLRENMEMIAEITGLSYEKRNCISEAFDEVGIKSQGNEFSTDFELTVTNLNGDICTDYTIEITGTKSSVFWEKETAYQDTVIVSNEQTHNISLPEGSYELKITDTQTGYSVGRKIRTAKLSRKDKLSITLISPATNIRHSEYITNQLLGEWKLDADKTYQETQKSLMSLFGTGIKYGSSMKFEEDGAFSYYIGIGIGGKGTYSVTDSDISYTVTTYEGGSAETGKILLDDSSGQYYLITDYFGDALYWKVVENASDSNEETDNTSNIDIDYMVYDPVIQAAINSTPGKGSGILYDIDGNGTKELIMLYANTEYQVVYDVYTIVSGQVVALAQSRVLYYEVAGNDGSLSVINDNKKAYFALTIETGETGYEAKRSTNWHLFKFENSQFIEDASATYEYQVMNEKIPLKAYINESETQISEYQSWVENIESNQKILITLHDDSNGIPLLQLLSKKDTDNTTKNSSQLNITGNSSVQELYTALYGRWYTENSAMTFYDFATDGSCRMLFDNAEPGTFEITSEKMLRITMPWVTERLDWDSNSLNTRKGWCITSNGVLIIKGVEYVRK